MTTSPPSGDTTKTLTEKSISPETVKLFLKENPTFFIDHPELLMTLIPPRDHQSDKVIDLQSFIVAKLREDIKVTKAREKELLTAAENNAKAQSRLHNAIKALLDVKTLNELVEFSQNKLPGLLYVDFSQVCVESENPVPAQLSETGIRNLKKGTIQTFMGRREKIVLVPKINNSREIFGVSALEVKSAAFIRFSFGPRSLKGLLALGTKLPNAFNPRQGTELLLFFSQILENCIQQWLNKKT